MWLYIVLGIVAIIVILLAIILIRTLTFVPKKNVLTKVQEIEFDKDRSVVTLQEMIKCKTISSKQTELEDENEFIKFEKLLYDLFPITTSRCERIPIESRCILFRWKGNNPQNVSVMMSHYDVVPVDETKWEKPPFDGVLENGVLWGRGALDTKVTLNAVMNSAEKLIKDGFVPQNDVYFAFSGGEEISADGAAKIVDYFENNNISVELVIDEGGAVVKDVFPGVSAPCGLIGIAEKGLIDLKYSVNSNGGHASAPKPGSPVVRLANACATMESKPFKAHLTKPVKEMFDTLGRHSTFIYKMIFSNLWIFGGVLDMICKKSGGEINALMRTTTAFTQMQGSNAPNVIPTQASLVSNMRLNPEDTVDSAMEYIKKTIDDDNVELTIIQSYNPSRISQTNCDSYNKVANAVQSTWEGTLVSPYLMVQCSDSRHYGRISDKVYRFSAMDLTSEERATVHGNNERIRVDAIHKSVEFYIRLLKNC